jgi:hypothetical protein
VEECHNVCQVSYLCVFFRAESLICDSSLVIDYVFSQFIENNVSVSYLYCDYQDQRTQSTTNIIGALLKQVMPTLPTVSDKTMKMLDRHSLSLADLCNLLSAAYKGFRRAYICIDALDECNDQYRVELLKSLKQMLEESGHSVRLFITGRQPLKESVYCCRRFKTVAWFLSCI